MLLAPLWICAAAVAWNAPVPAWTKAVPVGPSVQAPELAKTQSVLVQLYDEQTSTLGVRHYYFHRALQALQPIGLENVSEQRIAYDPSYEKLLIHKARVLRDGRVVFTAAAKDARIAQKDSSLVNRQFTSEVDVTIVMKGVRVGDVVECEYSLVGENPVFGGHPAGDFGLASLLPTLFSRTRLVAKPGQLTVRAHDADDVMHVTGNVEEWERSERRDVEHALRARPLDDLTPAWFDDWSHLEYSAYASWAEVVRWGLPLYPKQTIATPELEKWKALATPEEKLLAALRFVQNDVRYLGFELGPHSHKPHAPATVLKERLGDCKDKTYLLVQILHTLGIEAAPALVNTYAKRGLDDMLPSPLAFNHVIVLATLPDGREHFVDPTWTHQRGTLTTMTSVDYERALIVRPGETALKTIPQRQIDEALYEVNERFVVPSFESASKDDTAVPTGAAAELFTHTIFRGDRADGIRSYFASQRPDDVARELEESTSEDFEGAVLQEPQKIVDDEEKNVVETWAHFKLPAFWVDNKRELPARGLADAWPKKLRTVKRQTPFAIEHPTHVTHNIDVELPGPWTLPDLGAHLENPYFVFHRTTNVQGSHISMRYRLRTRVDHAPPSEAEAYNRAVAGLDGHYSIELFHDGGPALSVGAKPSDDGMQYYGVLALCVVGYFGVGIVRRRWKRSSVGRRYVHKAGETADRPLPASAAANVPALVASRACGCGKKLVANDSVVVDFVRLGERRLKTIEARCAACGKQNVIYAEAG